MSSTSTKIVRERHALVICDLQPDLLGSIATPDRELLLDQVGIVLSAARRANWLVVFTGLRFGPGYAGVSPRHKLYGGLARLNAKVGDDRAHWFLEGFEGSEIAAGLLQLELGDRVVWRQQHMPAPALLDVLRSHGTTKATIVGAKAAYSVQATAQALTSAGLLVSVVRDCVVDDNAERCSAVLEHLLPVFADVVSLADAIDDIVGMDVYADEQRASSPAGAGAAESRLLTDCGRGGHMSRYSRFLLDRPGWKTYPTQKWYMDEHFKEFLCPLGKKVVDFCDEPQFGQATTYLKGRDWLDDKAKVAEIAGDLHPETFVIKNGQWEGKQPPADEDARQAPWFIKEADKNWGNSIVICAKPSEIMGHVNSESSYVVQQHVPDPRCMDDGRKCHVKFYILLWCAEDGVSWELFTYKSAFLSISPSKWSADDLSTETQVTIVRHHEGLGTPEQPAAIGWADWAEVYPKFKHAVAKIIRQAVEEGKLEGRVGKRQFELFSADLMMDTHGAPWLFEFNMSPAICQHGFALEHDEKMMRDALSIVIPWEGGSGPGLWDAAGQFTGQTPAPETIRWAVEEGGPVQRTA